MTNKSKTDSVIQLEDVLVEATKRLDIDMFKEFAVHIDMQKNLKKSYFVDDLNVVFEKFKMLGDTQLDPILGICGRCNKDCYGYLFVGNNSKNHINFIFETKEMKVMEITECCEFKTIIEVLNLNERLYIHDYNNPKSNENLAF